MTDFAPLTLETPAEHPFAPFVRILGKGKRGARDMTREEAREAMGMLLDDKVEDTQLGAFLMLLRHKEESAEELAGFTEAVRERLHAPALKVDIDWPTYAGKKRHLPWYLLAAKCLAQNGVRVLLHGGGAHTAGRLYSEQLLDLLGIPLCRNWQAVGTALEQYNLAFIPLGDWAPQLQRMIDLRNTLGLRSPIHSLARVLNPLDARCGLQSIFHPGYQGMHREASGLLGDNTIVIKGDGGEVEMNPDTISHLYGTTGGQSWDEEWPALAPRRHVKPATLDPLQLTALWRGEIEDSYPQLALISTIALALRGLGTPRDEAFVLAQKYWDARDRSI
ncbi:glycosyl transferase family protein [Pseudomonas sp. 10B1]|uniref:glycosyl transferase family protein n=1 Tax=unclassified Pseudomonas TaxID=196821 RepID=UPI002AB5744E|nr:MULTISPECIES: glycosyl transferase family protein [unclassified Pseudomonas]MDY7559623.1 glycosyl transferase family protein [Pseudomonas sp. AB6]MEA9978455.1 glycosyl transferase family protein [Pseudomonas sp. RTS4]MEA9993141.1 glycosyl transferase family protein [Pseudomonas sp. AA4]MEB0086083.1 glycosyl transferase family protein [Pseudomonas sp. RTI1]MEB0125481.1 glycosyl transferase family protein [Pseudomonas sp. CCC1.2]